MKNISPEAIAEMQKMRENKATYAEIAKEFGICRNHVYKFLDYAKYRLYYCNGKYDKKDMPKATEAESQKKRVSQIKADCIAWIKKYYIESDCNNYPLHAAWADYEYHCLNPVIHDILSKSSYVKCLLECGFTRINKSVREGKAATNVGFFNLERRH